MRGMWDWRRERVGNEKTSLQFSFPKPVLSINKAYYFLWDRIIPRTIGRLTVAGTSFSSKSNFINGDPIHSSTHIFVAYISNCNNQSKINKS